MTGAGRVVRRRLRSPGQAGGAPRAGARACIKPDPCRRRRKRYGRQRYKHRNAVERFFGSIKQFRRVATRYEKKAENYLGFAWFAAVLVSFP